MMQQRGRQRGKRRGRLCPSLSKEDNEVSGAELTQCRKSQRAPGAWDAWLR